MADPKPRYFYFDSTQPETFRYGEKRDRPGTDNNPRITVPAKELTLQPVAFQSVGQTAVRQQPARVAIPSDVVDAIAADPIAGKRWKYLLDNRTLVEA